MLAAEYVGGGGGAGDSAAAVLPGSRLVAIDGQSVEGLSLDAMREIAEESAPTTLQFDGSAEADEWVAKEIAVAWILIHSLYDADGAVRIELVNGLAQFVAHHIDALLEALSDGDRAVTAEDTTLRQIWSSVLTLRADPLPSVADRANLIWVYLLLTRYTNAFIPKAFTIYISAFKIYIDVYIRILYTNIAYMRLEIFDQNCT